MTVYTEREKKVALRFHHTMTTGEYWDISVNALRHLIKIGLIHHAGCGRYFITEEMRHLAEEDAKSREEDALAEPA